MIIRNMVTGAAAAVAAMVLIMLVQHTDAKNLCLQSNGAYCMDAKLSPRWQMQLGGAMQLWQGANSDNQRVTYAPDTQLLTIGAAREIAVDVYNGIFQRGTHLQQYRSSPGNPNQEWRMLRNGLIQSVHRPQFCITVHDGDVHNGTPLVIDYCNEYDDGALWSFGALDGSGGSQQHADTTAVAQRLKKLLPNKRFLAWGVDDRFLEEIINLPLIDGLYHWAMGNVRGNTKCFMLMYWGTSKTREWHQRLAELGSQTPEIVLAFNEPDIGPSEGSAGMDAVESAHVYKREIHDRFAHGDTILVGPSINWDLSWLQRFMDTCDSLGCRVDAIGYHIYVKLNNNVDKAVEEVKNRVKTIYARFKRPILITEIGLARSPTDTPQQMKQFMTRAGAYLDANDAVAGWAFSGCYVNGASWDGYMTNIAGFFNADGSLTDLGYTYGYG